ncbi:transporter [Sphingobacteriaceae bacterium]|nr:transporter [Sphingobacteriaceae bacterium]
MKNIEITTSQNVTIQYGLANPWERALALALDLILMGLVTLLIFGIQGLIGMEVDYLLYFFVLPFVLLYSLGFEQLNNGQSFGKRVLKLRVIRMDGEQATFLDYLMRWIFRALDIYFSIGGVAVLSAISSKYNQRLGDLLANTVVVNVGKSERMALDTLLKLYKTKDHKVTYPQVAKMSEEAMLIVKETLSKKLTVNNPAHDEALTLLTDKMVKELNLKAPKDNQAFLKTLLKDYIILTR